MNLNQLYDERAGLITKAQALATRAKTENRAELNTEERAEFDKLLADVDAINAKIDAEKRAEEDRRADERRFAALNEHVNANANARPRQSDPPVNRNRHGSSNEKPQDTREYHDWFNAIVRRDYHAAGQIEARAGSPFSVGTDAVGGYLLVPTAVRNELIATIDEMCGIVGMARRLNIGDAKSIGITKVTARGDDADWTSEVTGVTADTALAIGRRDLTPTMATKKLVVSMSLLQRSPDAIPFVTQQMARLFGVTQEKALLTGTGSSQPLGIFVASSNGISTARDVTCASTTAFTYTELLQLKYNLKSYYQSRAKLFIHREFMFRALTLLDDQNRPIFIPSPSPGLADSIAGMPVCYSEFAPNTYTAAKYIAAYGDPSYIQIADAMTYSLQFADQLLAGTNQVAIFGRMEMDATPILEEAFSRLITHA